MTDVPQALAASDDPVVDGRDRDEIHLLDVGTEEYGDAILAIIGGKSILIDGAHPANMRGNARHPSIPDQLAQILGTNAPHQIDLLVATHAHLDHIGCLPNLVAEQVIVPKWALLVDPDLGWGRSSDYSPPSDANTDKAERFAHVIAAALREEPLARRTDDASVEAFLQDAADLEARYRQMIDDLETAGTRIVRHIQDDASDLENAFSSIGLKILGPSETQALICAERIARTTQDLHEDAAAAYERTSAADLPVSAVDTYRAMVATLQDAHGEADGSRPGAGVNLQSIVLRFEHWGRRFLFTGDMQLVKPGIGDKHIGDEIAKCRDAIRQDAPYAFVKLAHHGSDNACSGDFLDDVDATVAGICAGESSAKHPHGDVLEALRERRDHLVWARTDRNGHVTYSWTKDAANPEISKMRGRLSDPNPNVVDVAVPAAAPPTAASPPAAMMPSPSVSLSAPLPSASACVEITARIPVGTRVTITVEAEDTGTASARRPVLSADGAIRVGSGRPIPRLLFVTHRAALEENIGRGEAAEALASIVGSGHVLVDDLGPGSRTFDAAIKRVRGALRRERVTGVVLVGNYDVVPSEVVDALAGVSGVNREDDGDEFHVWSDDNYGRAEDISLPVSRIPDGRSSRLVRTALRAEERAHAQRRGGILNHRRPYGHHVFQQLPGTEQCAICEPDEHVTVRSKAIAAERLYILLHGTERDGTRFWGETAKGRYLEALNTDNVPPTVGGTVFTACCWGALPVDGAANAVRQGATLRPRTSEASLALRFLENGAKAFVGCTGSHWSPLPPRFDRYGRPFHDLFWRALDGSAAGSPALALHTAKDAYFAGIPHGGGPNTALQLAVERKLHRQYTCLGLGW